MANFRSSGVSVPGAIFMAVLVRIVSNRTGNNNFFIIWWLAAPKIYIIFFAIGFHPGITRFDNLPDMGYFCGSKINYSV